MVNGVFYAWGGYNTTAMYALDPVSNVWSPVTPDPPFMFYGTYAPTWRGKLVSVGNGGPIAVFDPSGPSWSTLAPPAGFTFDSSTSVATLPGAPDDLYLLGDTSSGGIAVYRYVL
jgi:hypothetical protein